MRSNPSVRLNPAAVMLGAAISAVLLFAISPATHGVVQANCNASDTSTCPTPTPTPSPSPSPIPTNAFLSLDVSAGPPNTQITVNGGAFLPNEQMTLYWDTSTHVAGGANADSSGNFTTHVTPFAGDAPGVHRLFASVPPNPFADFSLQAAVQTPSPSPSPSLDASPSPSPGPTSTDAASPSPVAATLSGIDLITRPPFVFLPILGIVAILVSVGYWVLSVVRRPRPMAIPTAAVIHRATRPDYTAGFGAPPAAPAPATPPPSAWADATPPAPTPSPGPATEPDAQASAPAGEPWSELEPQAPATGAEPPVSAYEPWPESGAQAADESDVPRGPDEPPDLPQPGED